MRVRSAMIWPLVVASFVFAGAASSEDSPESASKKEASAPSSATEKTEIPQDDPQEGTPEPHTKDKTKKSKTAKSKSESSTSSSAKSKRKLEKATFGGGCFWSIEAIFERIPGVTSVVSGFSGGVVPRPDYDTVCTGMTGHAEVVRVTYDPELITYEKLLKVFWSAHDPTTLNSQGEDVGTQYRSIIFYHNEDQKLAAQKSYQVLTKAGVFGSPIVTDLQPAAPFYPAESYHQDYYRKHRSSEYCQMVIAPKLRKLHLIK